MWLKSVLLWFGLMFLAIANGTVRVKWIIPATGITAGLAISSLLLCGLILLTTWFSVSWLGPQSNKEALGIGGLWLAMTLAFEFGAGHFLFKKPWAELLVDYDITQGRIWALVLLTTMLAPWLVVRMRGLVAG